MVNLENDLKEFLYYLEFGDQRSINSINSIKSDMKQFIEFITVVEPIESLKDINRFTVKRFIGLEYNKSLTKRSLNRKLSTIRLFFKFLLKKEKINTNPTKLVEFSNFSVEEPNFIKFDEINKLRDSIDLKTTNGLRDRLIIEMLYSTGITSQELLSLGEGVFDLDNRKLQIAIGKSSRVVFFSERVIRYFKEYISSKKEKYREVYNSDVLFVNGSGTRLSDRSLRRIIERYRVKSGITREVTPYIFRHTFILHMLVKGMNPEYLQEILGYSNSEILKKYKELSKRKEIAAYIL
ncbi:MAG: tyrosine-type recombinase/integrase [Fusobacteriaceae bacterium]